MSNNTGFKRRIKMVNVIGEDGTMAYPDVIITPDSDNVIVLSPNPSGSSAPLHDFLFRKFTYDTIEGAAVRYPGYEQKTTTDENGNEHTETVASYFQVSPISKSIWQSWYDYQDITKKRLVGLYKTEGETGEYVADFLLGRESDLQSLYTLELPEVDAAANIRKIKEAFDLHDKSTDNVDYKIPSDVKFKEDGNIDWSTFDEQYRYSEDDKAKELMLSFGNKSLWQAIIENEQKRKDRLIGIYKDGQLVGHFEATKYNLEALKEVYKDGVPVMTWEDDPDQQIYAGYVGSDKEAMDLLVDLDTKSVYQHLVDMQNTWIVMPLECYERDTGPGYTIANKYDITQLRMDQTPAPESTDYLLGYDKITNGYWLYGIAPEKDMSEVTELNLTLTEQLPLTGIVSNALSSVSSLKSFFIPKTVTHLEESIFASDPYSLETLSFPYCFEKPLGYLMPDFKDEYDQWNSLITDTLQTVTVLSGEIPDYAFASCSLISSITLEKGVTKIGRYAFRNTQSLHTLEIPESVTQLEEYIFGTNLQVGETTPKTVVLLQSDPDLLDIVYTSNEQTFSKSTIEKIVIPTGSKETYSQHEKWKNYAEFFIEAHEI